MERERWVKILTLLILAIVWTPGGTWQTAEGAPGERLIAYVRQKKEIRVITPEGAGDRRIWAFPEPDQAEALGIAALAWRPDGDELAFTSGHEAAASLYDADIYAIRPGSAALRRLTNPPQHADLKRFPKGTVRVPVENASLNRIRNTAANSGVFIVQVAGAEQPQQITLPVGSSKTLTFANVADLGRVVQPVVAMFGKFRWFIPGLDVRAGATTTSPGFSILGEGIEEFGARAPGWRADGSQIGFVLGGICAGLWRMSATPQPGILADGPFAGTNKIKPCGWDWGPKSTGYQVLHTGTMPDTTIYRVGEDGRNSVKLIAHEDGLITDLRWLPDGSGFLFGRSNATLTEANIYRHDFTTKRTTQVTRLSGESVRGFAIAPDGRRLVFERAAALLEGGSDLWVIGIDGSSMRLLVRNAHAPAW